MIKRRLNNSGQTLVALLIYMVVAMTITLTAVAVTIINIRANNSFSSGNQALQLAQDGVENAMIQIERNPSYSGETLTIGGGSDTITVSGSGSLTITSIGSVGNYRRTVTATATYASNILTLNTWAETP
jgi:hypothetical protein